MRLSKLSVGFLASIALQPLFVLGQADGTFRTPAFNGTGAATTTSGNQTIGVSTNSGTSLGPSIGTNGLGQPTTVIGQPEVGTTVSPQAVGGVNAVGSISSVNSTNLALPPGTISPVIPEGTVAVPGQQGIGTPGEQGTGTAIGQQGIATPGRQGTAGAIGQQGVGAIIPQTNAVIINTDGTVTGVPAQGAASESSLGATNSGVGGVFATNNTGTNNLGVRGAFGTNGFGVGTNTGRVSPNSNQR